MDVVERDALRVDHLRGELVLRHRPDREDRDEGSALVARSADPADEVGGERAVELRRVVGDGDPEVRIRVLGELRAGDAAHAIAFDDVAEVDESGEVVLEAEVDCHCRVLSSGKKAPRGCPEPGQAGGEALGVLDAALNAAEACDRAHLLDDVDAVVIA